MEILLFAIVFLVLLAIGGGYIWSVAWAIGDARKRGRSGGFIVFLIWLFGPFAAIAWLIARPRQALLGCSPADYSNADDALAAASRLDSLGDWDAALRLYRTVAARWPEHVAYAENCILEIQRKQAAI